MKKIILIAAVLGSFSFTNIHAAINEKVLKTFAQTFPSAMNAKWYEYENSYEVYFDKDDIKCRINYDFDGNVISTRRDYLEKDLTPFIKSKVNKQFPDKKIFGITEMTSNEEMYYLVILEDDKKWWHVKADGTGQLTVTQRYNKAAQ